MLVTELVFLFTYSYMAVSSRSHSAAEAVLRWYGGGSLTCTLTFLWLVVPYDGGSFSQHCCFLDGTLAKILIIIRSEIRSDEPAKVESLV